MAEPEYVTYAYAARVLDMAVSGVQRLVDRGLIVRRADHGPGRRPVLVKESVFAARDALIEEAAAADRRRAERERQEALRRRYVGEPPTLDGTEWWNAAQVAKALGLTRTGVAKRQARGKLPVVRHKGRNWYRADLVRLIANAERVKREGEVALFEHQP